MNNSNRYIQAAIAVAISSDNAGNARVGAVLVRKGTVLSAKHNSKKTHPALAAFTEYPHLHAESHCIISKGIDNCCGCDLYVVRLKKDGTLSMAKPCNVCRKLIDLTGIRKVWYSDWDGEIRELM